MKRARTIFAALLTALALAPAAAAHAQEPDTAFQADSAARSLPGWSVGRANREFMRSYQPVGFFPTRGEWLFVLTTHYQGAADRVGVWHFPAAQTGSVLDDGPLCGLFPFNPYPLEPEDDDPLARPWHRVSATRYVPPGSGPRSPVFVEWRREDGRWVVAALGGQTDHEPRVIGRFVDEAAPERRTVLRLPLPDWEPVAGGQPWYENDEPITVGGARLVKYGLPRVLSESDVVRWGTLRGVGVYVEPAASSRRPEVVYLPVDRTGSFQPYQDETDASCWW